MSEALKLLCCIYLDKGCYWIANTKIATKCHMHYALINPGKK